MVNRERTKKMHAERGNIKVVVANVTALQRQGKGDSGDTDTTLPIMLRQCGENPWRAQSAEE